MNDDGLGPWLQVVRKKSRESPKKLTIETLHEDDIRSGSKLKISSNLRTKVPGIFEGRSFQTGHQARGSYSYPVRHYWSGFDPNTCKERWFIELNNGRVINNNEDSYEYWHKKYVTIHS